MGDTTTFQAYVYACPPDQVDAALATLGAYSLQVNWGGRRTAAGRLEMSEPYTSHEVGLGTAEDIAAALIEDAPGCCFVLWEDPKHEWLGTLRAYTPELGQFTAECNADGQPVYTSAEITSMIEAAGDVGKDELIEALQLATGGPWFADWQAR